MHIGEYRFPESFFIGEILRKIAETRDSAHKMYSFPIRKTGMPGLPDAHRLEIVYAVWAGMMKRRAVGTKEISERIPGRAERI